MSTIFELEEYHHKAGKKYWKSLPRTITGWTVIKDSRKSEPEGRSGDILYQLLSLQQTPSWRETFGVPMSGKAKGITVLPWEDLV